MTTTMIFHFWLDGKVWLIVKIGWQCRNREREALLSYLGVFRLPTTIDGRVVSAFRHRIQQFSLRQGFDVRVTISRAHSNITVSFANVPILFTISIVLAVVSFVSNCLCSEGIQLVLGIYSIHRY